jgi:hypothetical protein
MAVTTHHVGGALGEYHASTPFISLHLVLVEYGEKPVVYRTLLHEMAHVLTWSEQDRHGPLWMAEMEAAGVDPLERTVIPGGRFAQFLAERGCAVQGAANSAAEINSLRAELEDVRRELDIVRNAMPTYKGGWHAGDYATKNSLVTNDGSLWLALEDTSAKPGDGDPAWRLS